MDSDSTKGDKVSRVFYGFYSKSSAELFDTFLYLDDKGRKVEVSCVTEDPEGRGFEWPDKEPRGRVTKLVRQLVHPQRLSRWRQYASR